MSRKEVDALTEVAKTFGAKGMPTLAITSEGVKGRAAKFVSAEELDRLRN